MIPNYILSVSEDGPEAVYETSYVNDPATGASFLKFNKDQSAMQFARIKNESYQRMTSGVWMMPDTKYLRSDEQGNWYSVQFTAESLFNALMKYLKQGFADAVKVEHQGKYLDGFVSIEHWIIRDKETRSPVFGLSLEDLGYNPDEIPVGTVMKTTYVADESFWNEQVLSGNVTGYSIGGLFNLDEMNFNNEAKMAQDVTDIKAEDLKDGDNIVGDQVITVMEGVIVDVSDVPTDKEVSGDEEEAPIENEIPEQKEESNSEIMEMLKQMSERLSALEQENNSLKDQFTEKEKEAKELRSKLMNQPMTSESNFSTHKVSGNDKQFKTIVIGGIEKQIRNF